MFKATAVKSTSFYQLFTTYVSLALHQMVTSVLILYPKTYTILNSSKKNYCAINVGLEVENMNHIKRGHYLSSGTARREGLGGGALAPQLFCKNKNKLNKK